MSPNSSLFEDAYETHYPQLVGLASSITGSIETGHDLAQETMTRAFDHWHRVGQFDVPFAWMRKVLVNMAVDWHRRDRARRKAVGRLTRSVRVRLPPPELDRWAELTISLTDRQRMIAALYYADDQSVDTIAELLDAAPGTIKATLSQVRARLRTELSATEGRHDG